MTIIPMDPMRQAREGARQIQEALDAIAAQRAQAQEDGWLDAEQILALFERHGFSLDSGSTYSVKGQIAQLLNAARELVAVNAPPSAEQSVTVRYDLAPAQVDGAIRDQLIALGWTPPSGPIAQTARRSRVGWWRRCAKFSPPRNWSAPKL